MRAQGEHVPPTGEARLLHSAIETDATPAVKTPKQAKQQVLRASRPRPRSPPHKGLTEKLR